MARKKLNILTVCGSGVVSCSMFDGRIRELLQSLDVDLSIIGTLPPSVETLVNRGDVDFVVSTSKIPGEIKVPVIDGVALLSGFGEDECLEKIKQTAMDILAKK
jgi:PTS system galactitol-specific IIB component